MDRPQLIHRLRIAVSVFFAVVAVALCVLWVRSYWWAESLYRGDFVAATTLGANAGTAYYLRVNFPDGHGISHGWRYSRLDATNASLGFRWSFHGTEGIAATPLWAPVLILAALAVMPRLSHHFLFPTLLIATTLVAVALGLGVWAAR